VLSVMVIRRHEYLELRYLNLNTIMFTDFPHASFPVVHEAIFQCRDNCKIYEISKIAVCFKSVL
jgi:hypothetical protein